MYIVRLLLSDSTLASWMTNGCMTDVGCLVVRTRTIWHVEPFERTDDEIECCGARRCRLHGTVGASICFEDVN